MKTDMDDSTLLRILKEEERRAAAYYDSELASVQAESMRRFHALPYGTEREGRSTVVTHDVEDTIAWMMPHLMRTFLSNDDIVTVEDEASDDADMMAQAADYLSHIFFKDNPGDTILHDFAFDGLLQRIGVIRVGWEDPKPEPAKEYHGLAEEQLVQLHQDQRLELLEADQGEDGTFSVLAQRTDTVGRVKIDVIPPEEYAFEKRSASGEHCSYRRWKRRMFLGDVAEMFPDHAAELRGMAPRAHGDESSDEVGDTRRYERFPDEYADGDEDHNDHESRREVDLIHEEIRIDYDGDGAVELRSVYRVQDIILENVEIERSHYVEWSPIRVAHRLAGRSLADVLIDIQRIRTEITRLTLDGLAQSLVPRHAADQTKLGDGGLDALLDAEVGGVVLTKGNPNEVLSPMVTPDVSGSAYPMLEYWDRRSEEATGVNKHSQGIADKAITDTAAGIGMLQAAANGRIELVARWLGKSLERVFENALHLISAHQDQPRIVKINGKPLPIDPSRWSEEMAVSVHVGNAGEDRQMKLMNLNAIKEEQKEILLTMGPNNPLVSLQQYRETLAQIASVMGFKDPAMFVKEISEDWQPPPQEQQPDPEVEKAKAQLQIKAQEAQFNAQMKEKEFAHNQQIEQMKLANDREMQAAKLQSEHQIAQMRIQAETDIANRRMEAEQELARWKAAEDARHREKVAEHQAKAAEKKAVNGNGQAHRSSSNGAGGGVRMGGKIG